MGDGKRVCGGGVMSWTEKSCINLTDHGTWETTTTLLEERDRHSMWASPSGLILMGGLDTTTSEKIKKDGTTENSFPLKTYTVGACAINLDSSVIIAGGYER